MDTRGKKKLETQLIENSDVLKMCSEKLSSLKIEGTIESVVEQIAKYEKIREYYTAKKQLDELTIMLAESGEKIKLLNYDPAMEKIFYEKFKDAERNAALLKQEHANLLELINEKKKRLTELQSIKQEIEKSKKEVEYLSSTKENFDILENVLLNAQTKLRQEFTDTTNVALTDVWQRIYPYGDYTDLRIGIDESGDYILQLRTLSNSWVNVEGITSGGERSIASLALRISFSLVLTQNLSWLVLDEPTHNLDKQAVSELAETLRDHLPKIVDQIFIITHEPLLEEAASAYLYKLDRKKKSTRRQK